MSRSGFCYCLVVVAVCTKHLDASEVCVSQTADMTHLSLCGGAVLHSTSGTVTNARGIDVPGSALKLALCDETPAGGSLVHYYAVSYDGVAFQRPRKSSYMLKTKLAGFDPTVRLPGMDPSITADASNRLHIVQFHTHPLGAYRQAITALGGTIRGFLSNHAHLVEMTDAIAEQVRALPFVRWVGTFHPGYKLEPWLIANLPNASQAYPLQRYNVLLFNRDFTVKTAVALSIAGLGGIIDPVVPGDLLLQATLTPSQLLAVIKDNRVSYVDRLVNVTEFMDVARELYGANYLETVSVPGFNGQGVVGEVMVPVLKFLSLVCM